MTMEPRFADPTDIHFEGERPEPEAIRARVEEILGQPVVLFWQVPGFWVLVNDWSPNSGEGVVIEQCGNTLEMCFQEDKQEPELVRQALIVLGGRCEPLDPPRPLQKERRFRFHFAGAPPTPKAICEQVEHSGGRCSPRGSWSERYWLRTGANRIQAELKFVDSTRIIIEPSFEQIMKPIVAAMKSLGGRAKHSSSPKP
jgi:hypothetical protein